MFWMKTNEHQTSSKRIGLKPLDRPDSLWPTGLGKSYCLERVFSFLFLKYVTKIFSLTLCWFKYMLCWIAFIDTGQTSHPLYCSTCPSVFIFPPKFFENKASVQRPFVSLSPKLQMCCFYSFLFHKTL